jgi:hypothetical protein
MANHIYNLVYCKIMNIIICHMEFVATLALALRPKQGLVKVRVKSEVRESHFMLSRV